MESPMNAKDLSQNPTEEGQPKDDPFRTVRLKRPLATLLQLLAMLLRGLVAPSRASVQISIADGVAW